MSYEESAKALQPPYLQGPRWQSFVGAIGQQLDTENDRMVESAFVGTVERAPDDALPDLGLDRATPRYPAEPDLGYRLRLSKTFSTKRKSGTVNGIIEGFNDATTYTNSEEDPAEWALIEYSDDPATFATSGFWAQFLLVADPANTLGEGWVFGTDHQFGETDLRFGLIMTADMYAFLRRLIEDFTPAYAVCAGLRLVMSAYTITIFEDFR